MTTIHDAVRARLLQIAVSGLGADGALGPKAQSLSIPAGRFRVSVNRRAFDDEGYPVEGVDRALHLRWLSIDDRDTPQNAYDGPGQRILFCELRNGVLYGKAQAAAHLKLVGSETAVAVLLEPEGRALNDAERLRNALSFTGLLQAPAVTDPLINGAWRVEPSRFEKLGIEGRACAVTLYRISVTLAAGSTYDP